MRRVDLMEIDWIKAGKSLLAGIVFALIVFLFSGSDSSVGFGLLLTVWLYLRKEEKKE